MAAETRRLPEIEPIIKFKNTVAVTRLVHYIRYDNKFQEIFKSRTHEIKKK